MRNITLRLPVGLLRRAKVLAAQEDTSLSQMMARSLESMVSSRETFWARRAGALRRLSDGFQMGTKTERYDWKREDLHERDD